MFHEGCWASGEWIHLQGRLLFKNCCGSHSEKRSTLKGKNLLPLGANSFLLEHTSFQKRLVVQESKQEVSKVVFLVQNGVSSPFECEEKPLFYQDQTAHLCGLIRAFHILL